MIFYLIFYIHINQFPRSDAFLAETLEYIKLLKNVEKTVSINYDLALAKKVMEIEFLDKPKYKHVFINPDAFHVDLAFS